MWFCLTGKTPPPILYAHAHVITHCTPSLISSFSFFSPLLSLCLSCRSQTLAVAYNPRKDSYRLLKDPQDAAATARATYHTNVNLNGWNFFEAKALPASSSHAAYLDSLRAMGYLEGLSSWKQIVDFYPNYYQSERRHVNVMYTCIHVYIMCRYFYASGVYNFIYLCLYVLCVVCRYLRHQEPRPVQS
jgi:hypothetical protein